MTLGQLRALYHQDLFHRIIRLTVRSDGQYPNIADGNNSSSIAIADALLKRIGLPVPTDPGAVDPGTAFEKATRDYMQGAFSLITHLRPGRWQYDTSRKISEFDQYAHLADIDALTTQNPALASAFGIDYIIKPDVVVLRTPVTDEEINADEMVVDDSPTIAAYTPLRARSDNQRPILHASISCKWTLRSDRAQNARTEALNLIRNRKGSLPHIVAVTAEPLPTRIASLALGTGDLDCVYHVALPELVDAVGDANRTDQLDMLHTLIQGRRLRDISDLPLDLAV